jgi:hypothetical protein
MRRFNTMWIYAAGATVSAFVFRFTDCPDSFFACLSAAFAVDVVTSMLRMCNRLLDPPVGIFVVFSLHQNNFNHLLHMP